MNEPTLEPCAKFEPWIPAELVVRDPWVCAGEPTMRGTRILAETIVAELAIGTTWETLQSMYPSIPIPASQEPPGPPTGPERGTGEAGPEKSAQAATLRDASTSIRTIADHMPGRHPEFVRGVRYAATLLGHTADDLGAGDG